MGAKRVSGDDIRLAAWARIIRDLIAERGTTAKLVAQGAMMNYAVLLAFLKGEAGLTVCQLERVLAVLGHDLEALARQPKIRQRVRPVATRCNESA